jgi:RHS repeat-associated protein
VQYNATTGTTTVVNHVRYDTFGQIVSQTNSQFQPWFAYTGREWDPAVGLYFYRARWYDPRAGRFTSEDPLGFAAGDANLSRYVGNGATLWVDPSGETKERAPTKNTYRKKFFDSTPDLKLHGPNVDIHHTLQQDEVIADRFKKERGINVHELQHLRGVDGDLHDIMTEQQNQFWREKARQMSSELGEPVTITDAKMRIDLDIVEKHSKALTDAFEDCMIKSGDNAKAIKNAVKNTQKVLNDPKLLATRLASFYKNIDWRKLHTAAQLLVLAHLVYSSGTAIASPTPEQQQIRDDFQARFTSTLNYSYDHHYINQEQIDKLRSTLIPYLNSIGVPDQAQTAIQLKLSLIETHSP